MKTRQQAPNRPIQCRSAEGSCLCRREFITQGALLGVAAGVAGVGFPATASAEEEVPSLKRAEAPGFQPLEVNSPMAKWKKPLSLEFVRGANARYTFPNWQSGNDDSAYYNLNLAGGSWRTSR